jgi:hypothetical protein
MLWYVALFQGLYYGLTGLWPLFNLRTFMKVTGPKTDQWLVRCVGILITLSAAAILYSIRSPAIPSEIKLLAVGEAAALGILETYYVLRRVISPIYLADAVLQTTLIFAWLKFDSVFY